MKNLKKMNLEKINDYLGTLEDIIYYANMVRQSAQMVKDTINNIDNSILEENNYLYDIDDINHGDILEYMRELNNCIDNMEGLDLEIEK